MPRPARAASRTDGQSPPSVTPATDNPPLRREIRGHVAVLTMNRPQARNSLSEAMLSALQSALDDLAKDDTVRAIVLAGEGPAFSAGHDLKEMTGHRGEPDGGRAYTTALLAKCATMMQTVVMSPKPVIAAIEGIATAAGCQLVGSCDLAVAGAKARFATSGINIGLFCATPMVAVSRNVSRKRALEMLLLGDMIDAETAADWGLVNRVVPEGQAVAAALGLANRIAEKLPAAIAIGKRAFYGQIETGLAEAYVQGSCAMAENMMLDDAKEGIDAFIEKRQPTWTVR